MQSRAFLERKLREGRCWKAGGGGSLGIANAIFTRRLLPLPSGSRRLRPPVTHAARRRAALQALATTLQQLAGTREIVDTMIAIPHPYDKTYAEVWISSHADAFARRTAVHFGITLKATGELIGSVELHDIETEHSQAELSFWVGKAWWGQGYITEAARSVLGYGLYDLELNRIYAYHMKRNPASGRVLHKLGMVQEGVLRQRVRKWGVFEDVAMCALLRQDWDN
ncbi:MAG: GNAT family N-acetyltransferase [Candidatus Tectomicrobia bacterium]